MRYSARLPRVLGWASVAVGLPMLTRPAIVTRALGVGDAPRHRRLAVLVGAREFAAAAGLLTRPSSPWLWSRVAGDAVDLGLLATAARGRTGNAHRRTATAVGAVAAITAVDVYAATRSSGKESDMELTATTTIRTSPQELYEFWRRLDHLPTFMAHVEDVRVTGERTSHWQVSAPFGRKVEWDAEITEDEPGALLAWRSVEAADVQNEGEVRFAPAPRDQGTEVRVRLAYRMPAGKLGELVARYFGEDPHQQLDDDLRRLKQVVETGEVVRSDGAPYGKRARKEFPQRPAQPLSDEELKEVHA